MICLASGRKSKSQQTRQTKNSLHYDRCTCLKVNFVLIGKQVEGNCSLCGSDNKKKSLA